MSIAVGLVASELGLFGSMFSGPSEVEVASWDSEEMTRRVSPGILV